MGASGFSGMGGHLDVIVLVNFALGVILPQVVAVVTHKMAGSNLKAVVLLALSAVAGVLTQIAAQGGDFHWKPALLSVGMAFVTSVAAHFGLLKPTGITGSAGAIQSAMPAGLGRHVQPPTPNRHAA